MINNEQLSRVLPRLAEHNLGGAIVEMEIFLSVHPHQVYSDRLYAIKSDFQMMADYWRKGYRDPQFKERYDNLLRLLYALYSNMSLDYAVGHSTFLSSIHLRVHMTARDFSPLVVRESLESFVSDVAMASLEPEHTRKGRLKEIYGHHQLEMDVLFDAVWTSPQWSKGVANAWAEMLLSPTVDTIDQQLLVSAVMLSVMNFFDMAKFRLLTNVYRNATDEKVRQRALVGWVVALESAAAISLYPEVDQIVADILADEDACKEITELQMQMFYCLDAEEDNRKIQREIMPDLLRRGGFRITPDGIKEAEDDPLEDILHPDAAEQNMERVEQSFQRMRDMQKQGSDIYFGGFSQMKRFPFFQTVSNWFVPFYMKHPQLSNIEENYGRNRFFLAMMKKGPFCNSDKYSFALAFDHVVGQLPENVREMFDRGEAEINEMADEEMQTSAYVRRTYLQDMYRFFRIFSHRDEYRNPFTAADNGTYLPFAAHRLFSQTGLHKHFGEIAAFLIKRRRYGEAAYVLDNYTDDSRDYQFYVLTGNLLALHRREIDSSLKIAKMSAAECYSMALEKKVDDERAMAGLARAKFAEGDYNDALRLYERLAELRPEKASYQTSKAACMANLSMYDEAQQLLFRLNYERPDDDFVSRLLAWTLVCSGKYEQAGNIYSHLLAQEDVESDDVLRYGYCLWFGGSVSEAVDCFKRYLKETGNKPNVVVESEYEIISEKGISEPEILTMLFLLM